MKTLIEKTVKKERKKLYVAFIDFKKAYDTVDRSLLFGRLRQVGIDGTFYRNIVEMYRDTKYSIKLKNGYWSRLGAILGSDKDAPYPRCSSIYLSKT